jgi:hypothetical protein
MNTQIQLNDEQINALSEEEYYEYNTNRVLAIFDIVENTMGRKLHRDEDVEIQIDCEFFVGGENHTMTNEEIARQIVDDRKNDMQ